MFIDVAIWRFYHNMCSLVKSPEQCKSFKVSKQLINSTKFNYKIITVVSTLTVICKCKSIFAKGTMIVQCRRLLPYKRINIECTMCHTYRNVYLLVHSSPQMPKTIAICRP